MPACSQCAPTLKFFFKLWKTTYVCEHLHVCGTYVTLVMLAKLNYVHTTTMHVTVTRVESDVLGDFVYLAT